MVDPTPRCGRRAIRRLGAFVVALTGLGSAGCPGLLDGFDAGVEPPPDMRVVNGFVAGEWQISGDGRFDVCDSPFSEVAFQVRSMPLTVEQDAIGRLTVSDGAGPDGGMFRFEDGAIVGTEVRFTTREETERGPIRLEYVGALDELNNVRGLFEGIGPDACLSSGRFTARVELAELPPWLMPEPDAAPPDAGAADARPADGSAVDAAPERVDGAGPDAG